MAAARPQLSVAVALPVLAGSEEAPHCNCLSAGQVITGAVISIYVMCCTQALVLPQASVAFQVRSMPGWLVQLASVAASAYVMVTVPPQLSVAVAFPRLAVSVAAPQVICLA